MNKAPLSPAQVKEQLVNEAHVEASRAIREMLREVADQTWSQLLGLARVLEKQLPVGQESSSVSIVRRQLINELIKLFWQCHASAGGVENEVEREFMRRLQ